MAYDAILSVLDLKWQHEHELAKIARLAKNVMYYTQFCTK